MTEDSRKEQRSLRRNSHTRISRAIASMVCSVIALVFCLFVASAVPFGDGADTALTETLVSEDAFEAFTDEERAEFYDSKLNQEGEGRAENEGALSSALPSFEEGVVVTSLAEGATIAQVEEVLSTNQDFAGIRIQNQTNSVIELSLPSGLTVEDALEKLSQIDAFKNVQPNYYYYPVDEETGELIGDSQSDTSDNSYGNTYGNGYRDASGDAFNGGYSDTNNDAFSGGLSAALVDDETFTKGSLNADAGSAESDEYSTQSSRNDPLFSSQWSLTAAKVSDAWDYVSTHVEDASNPPVIAVIDQGFFLDHQDFDQSRIVGAYNAALPSLSVGLGTVSHGTHVLGIIGATSNNGFAVAGTVDNKCKLMPIEVEARLNGELIEGMKTTTLTAAYDYIVDQKAAGVNVRVVNMSLGGGRSIPGFVTGTDDLELYNAIDRAKNQGITTVVAACNEDPDKGNHPPFFSSPSDFDNVISVINLTRSNNADGVVRTSTSNYNTAYQQDKNISAPGTSIIGLSRFGTSDSSTTIMSGTSMASPLVAGIAGLMVVVEPSISPDTLMKKMYSTAKDITYSGVGWDRETGYGIVNAKAAVESADNATTTDANKPTIEGTYVLVKGESAQFRVSVSGQNDAGYTWVSSNTSVASVSRDGSGATATVKANTYGTAVITATKGTQTVRQVITVCDIVGSNTASSGSSYQFSVGPYTDGGWYWSISNTQYASIGSTTGVLTVKTTSVSQRVPITITARNLFSANLGQNRVITKTVVLDLHEVVYDMYRLHSPITGEHLYTADINERETLRRTGWVYEGIAWQAPANGENVYRLYSSYSGDHHYTTSNNERLSLMRDGWNYEGICWKSGGTKPVYRLVSPYLTSFYHHYTLSENEWRTNVRQGWILEGIGWYGM